ncbi:50S ribosomal protein L9 [Wenyingzhuangia sp. 2_MG-2023]|uniref:50S ribosomal protein L9 n=1 Tax=Wenyingzhuangia sp. 2_MG-2023 TaxID=3062639 RepID=UPI0026E3BBDD|nr:50S ribosomal protein L9 [Wenyingzhuangia sp. 2_MG-2023]MDO6737795.1 50S ribosomal protein L9 [Wenyingzhuangia sp. 2_MG-2023]MDO6802078.1 50S ribosomal protein L9 [Wenyingzhuangia sp. 1_MG-2023]
MQVILKQDVENLGFADDIVEVKNGYGRNFLIPTGKAVLATESAKKVLAETLKQRAYKEAKLVEEANVTAEAIKELEIKLTSKVGQGTKLFGSISNIDIAESLAKAGHSIERKFIKIAGGSIKRTGKYTASVRLHRTVTADLEFEIVGE